MKAARGTRRVAGIVLSLTFFAGLIEAQSPSGRHDTQVWNDTQLTIPVSKTVDFVLLGTLRIGREVTRPVDERIGLALTFKVGKYLTFQPAYLYISTQPLKNVKSHENRLGGIYNVKIPIGGFQLSNRGLFERRIRSPQIDSTRYRHRLQVEHPLHFGDFKLNGIVSDEIFYDWSFNAWVRNRFLIGVGRTFNKHATLELYYLRQNDGHNRPGDLNVLGTTLRLHL